VTLAHQIGSITASSPPSGVQAIYAGISHGASGGIFRTTAIRILVPRAIYARRLESRGWRSGAGIE
jgi:hypothetical protein